MTYNILNYRNFTSYCTSSNNNPVAKEAALREVVQYLQPDLLVCNEVGGATPSAHEKILTDVLNTNGVNRWASTSYTNNGFSTLVNGIYYDKNKLGVQPVVQPSAGETAAVGVGVAGALAVVRCVVGVVGPRAQLPNGVVKPFGRHGVVDQILKRCFLAFVNIEIAAH